MIDNKNNVLSFHFGWRHVHDAEKPPLCRQVLDSQIPKYSSYLIFEFICLLAIEQNLVFSANLGLMLRVCQQRYHDKRLPPLPLRIFIASMDVVFLSPS